MMKRDSTRRRPWGASDVGNAGTGAWKCPGMCGSGVWIRWGAPGSCAAGRGAATPRTAGLRSAAASSRPTGAAFMGSGLSCLRTGGLQPRAWRRAAIAACVAAVRVSRPQHMTQWPTNATLGSRAICPNAPACETRYCWRKDCPAQSPVGAADHR